MSKAWTYQKAGDVRDKGEGNAPWYVGWLEPDGRRRAKNCGAGPAGKKLATRVAAKITAELMTGTYEMQTCIVWDDFVKEYARRILDGLEPLTRRASLDSLAQFKRHLKPVRVFAINTGHIDDFVARRRQDRGRKYRSTVSPATINKDLRHLKAALNAAVEWGYLTKAPRFRMERVPRKLVRFVTPEHFAAIYAACGAAKAPRDLPYPAADWWRALLVTAYMTGWRISDLLALLRCDLDLETGHAITRAEDNKGDRDDRVKLHQAVIDHLKVLASFDPLVFPWPRSLKTLHAEFDRIQAAAGIHLPCRERHEHTPACHTYGFHDFRRAFATMNAPRLTPDALQALMRHKSYLTTQVYINMARQIDDAVNVLHVPEFLKPREVGGVSGVRPEGEERCG
jgi:integrase